MSHTIPQDAGKATAVERGDAVLVVGIGASAGGIHALKRFFAAVPDDSGMAYVVVLHLSPDHHSALADVLQPVSRIPVVAVHERVRFEPNRAYVVSPSVKLALNGPFIEVSPIAGVEERRAPIDIFFRTLARSQQASAACVVLSGTGVDGSTGLKHVKEYGGLCIAQQPSEAEFPEMPAAAIETGFTDYVLPAGEMPARLAAYRRHLDVFESRHRAMEDPDDQALRDIFAQMRMRTGHDFTSYKLSTVRRRLERRMSVREVESLAAYANELRNHREEAQALLKDLLISVTGFFRDPEAFQVLERDIVPKLFRNKGPEDHVRVWVAGCATGEEAYSIAMLLSEYAPDPASGPAVQVFATDIDEAALARARAGLYTLNDAADVSPERLRRFFTKEGTGLRVRREVREMVLFAAHNAIKDPPFAHLDLVACRNLLIYLNRTAQERVLKLFHFALDPGGYLFLGTSESAEDFGNMFVAMNKEAHLFESRGVAQPMAVLPPVPAPLAAPAPFAAQPMQESREARSRERLSYLELHQRLLEQLAPPSVLVNQDFEILHLSPRAGRYLQFVGGEPSQNLLKVARPELRLELHSALYHAIQNRTNTEAMAGPLTVDGRAERVKLAVSPVFDDAHRARGLILVIFENVDGPHAAEPATARLPDAAGDAKPIAQQLEEEVARLRMQLRGTIEQYEVQQEELKASNEELQAMNEELRSSTEELETSKEELQSVNEELTTVNQELKAKIRELWQSSNDTRNLIDSSDVAILFVDRNMRIKLFTRRAQVLFNIIGTDVGRSLLDITHRLAYPEMAADIATVLDSSSLTEREVRSEEGRLYVARALPYRTGDGKVGGAVLTFADVTDVRRGEQDLLRSEERWRLTIGTLREYAIFSLDCDGRIASWNAGAREVFGFEDAEAIGQPAAILFTPEDREAGVPEEEMRQARENGRALDERWHQRKDGSRLFVSGVMSPMLRDGRLVGYTKVARDLTERMVADGKLTAAHAELEERVLARTGELAEANAALKAEIGEHARAEEGRLALLRQVLGAQEQERARISRELHDQLGQEVTALALKLALLRRHGRLPEELRAPIEELQLLAKRIDSDLEFVVWELRPTGLDDLGLVEALTDYVGHWRASFKVGVRLVSQLEGRLPPEVETALYRIAQEALNNVAKHAGARKVEVTLGLAGDQVELVVRDDGAGFEPDAASDPKSMGLVGIRERAALVGGTVDIQSRPDSGTTVRVRVPSSRAAPRFVR